MDRTAMPPAEPLAPRPPRLLSLDALRGFDMLWIVGGDAVGIALGRLVGGGPGRVLVEELDHAAWAGFHFYDLIFPTFVFMAGAAIPFSLDRMVATAGRPQAIARILRRVLCLVLLGILYYGGLSTPLAGIRLLGVLQRIGLCYGAAALLYLYLRPRGLAVTAAALLVGYWALLRFVPVPDFGAGDFAEGHNLTNWIDSRYLPLRKWDGDHDPEGLLSTLPAVASCLLGVFAGLWLRAPGPSGPRRGWLLVAGGVALVLLGSAWGLEFPVIKKIWTSSFVLVAGGWSAVLLGTFYLVIDVAQARAWAWPFVWVGCNPLALYLATNVIDFGRLAERLVGGGVAQHLDALHPGLGDLGLAVVLVALCFALCGFLYRRKIFLRL